MDFSRFSSQSFEQMVQALSVPILGAGVVVFGNGRDGGRDAAFEGKVPFPSEVDNWDGYIVVQAKCKDKLTHGSKDADWLCDQLTKELKKFTGKKKKKYRRPEYYILATNVSLSGVPDSGGKDKIKAIIQSSNIGFKDFRLWSSDELRAFLDKHSEIRSRYSSWLTSSDVLSSLIQSISQPDIRRLLPLAIARDLRAERGIKMKEAGHEAQHPIYLEDIFIDLPLQRSREQEIEIEIEEPTPSSTIEQESLESDQGSTRAARGQIFSLNIDTAQRLYADNTRRRGFLPILVNSISSSFSEDEMSELAAKLPPEAKEFEMSDTPAIRHAVGLLRLASGKWTDAEQLADELTAGLNRQGVWRIVNFLATAFHSDDFEHVVKQINRKIRELGFSEGSSIHEWLEAMLEGTRTRFEDEDHCKALRLPHAKLPQYLRS